MSKPPRLSWFPVRHMIKEAAGRGGGDTWIDEARSFGFDAVEVHELYLRSEPALESVRARVLDADLAVSMVTAAPDLTSGDSNAARQQEEALARLFEVAASLGARFVRVTAGRRRAVQADLATIASRLGQLAERAKTYEVTLCFENHFRDRAWSDDAVDITFDLDIFRTLVAALRDSKVMVNFDTAQAIFARADPAALLAEVVDRVAYIHAGDRLPGERRHVVIGEGDVNFSAVFNLLASHGFAGFVAVEDGSAAADEGTRRAVAHLRKAFAEVWK